MTATERLRQLLDERGVEWWTDFAMPTHSTYFEPDGGMTVSVWEHGGKLGIEASTDYRFTPEQAVDATLGRGTCGMELPDLRGPAYTDVYVCSECGGEVMVGTVMGVSDVPKWCPWCGRRVEE